MTWNTIMGFVSSFALFIPIALILLLKLGSYRSFAALLIYYTSVIIFNLMSEGYIHINRNVNYFWGIANNMLDVPLMLTFLTYFSPSKKYTQRMKILAVAFILFELIVMIVTRFSINGLTIILGPGLIIISGLCLHFFIRYATMAIEHGKATGKAFIAGSMLFAYGCFSILYVMYYIIKTEHKEAAYLIFFIATSISALLMSAGLIIEWRRIKKIKELKITRKELSEMYKDTNMAAPKRTAMLDLDFDKEVWN
ncbi:MAG: hypothetical protein ABIP79_09940 [Chitinophagaceae bacterium]